MEASEERGGRLNEEESGESEDNLDDLIRLLHGIESNMTNLRSMRKIPDFLPENVQSLNIVIDAQIQLLHQLINKNSKKDDDP